MLVITLMTMEKITELNCGVIVDPSLSSSSSSSAINDVIERPSDSQSWCRNDRDVRSITQNMKKGFQKSAFHLVTMQQTGADGKLVEARGPLPLMTPLCEPAKSLKEGRV